ncbi:helix-turn-helix domain-containing protein [Desulfitobacterium hafniense]|uniref:helix-turn-helix domain-containing protein n=1 Tax=Desulfitobacterium hafniense TaxID=49338 RepID=UPI00035DA081|nr:helix-turn-helix transcriptional regulator [Desulfitobacterium hafniense]
MDNKKFGEFIATLRKEKNWTQAELAQKLNVTDKAISKWERGLGFPDIKTIEPLADALGVSVLEIMQCEHKTDEVISTDGASQALMNTIDLVKEQRRKEKRDILRGAGIVGLIMLSVLAIDNVGWFAFATIWIQIIALVIGVALLAMGIHYKRQQKPCTTTFVVASVCLLYPIAWIIFLCIAFVTGIGPITN